MTYYAVQVASGKWLSRARFDATFNAAFELAHPELFDSEQAARDAAKGTDTPIVVPFEIVTTPTGSEGSKP